MTPSPNISLSSKMVADVDADAKLYPPVLRGVGCSGPCRAGFPKHIAPRHGTLGLSFHEVTGA